jgi:hypothetical protein
MWESHRKKLEAKQDEYKKLSDESVIGQFRYRTISYEEYLRLAYDSLEESRGVTVFEAINASGYSYSLLFAISETRELYLETISEKNISIYNSCVFQDHSEINQIACHIKSILLDRSPQYEKSFKIWKTRY